MPDPLGSLQRFPISRGERLGAPLDPSPRTLPCFGFWPVPRPTLHCFFDKSNTERVSGLQCLPSTASVSDRPVGFHTEEKSKKTGADLWATWI